jgi:hypothetical protein
MQRIGVTPMPPASSRLFFASCASGKWFFGALMVTTSPGCTRSCMPAEPPRVAGSRSTAIW